MSAPAVAEAWTASCLPVAMLRCLGGRCSHRKARLLACGLARAIAELPFHTTEPDIPDADEQVPAATGATAADGDTAETPALGAGARPAAETVELPLAAAGPSAAPEGGVADLGALLDGATMDVLRPLVECDPARTIDELIAFGLDAYGPENGRLYTRVIRCVAGNPFRTVALDPDWRTQPVARLARAIHEGREFHRLPELADRLEAAGCHDPDVLEHCRAAGPHARGCWVVDLLLGKG